VNPLGVKVELLDIVSDGAWTDITPDVLIRDGITINRGQADEQSATGPGVCTLTLRNTAGKYSPRNASGAFYGRLRRNTPIRVSLAGVTHLDIPAGSVAGSAYLSAPDSAGLSVTGDLDLRVDLWLLSWRRAGGIMGKFLEAGNQRSYALYLTSGGRLRLYWSANGSTAAQADSTAAVPISTGRLSARATIDVDNGAGGSTVTFYVSTTPGALSAGPWVQLGDTVVVAGTTSIFNSTSPVFLGNTSIAATGIGTGKIYAAQIRSGIGGAIVGNPDLSLATSGATSLTDSTGTVWTQSGTADITSRDVRFVGEVAAWPTRWDISERDVFGPLEASGPLRRLGQGVAPIESTMQRGITSLTHLVAHWPLTDTAGATRLGSAVSRGKQMIYTLASPSLASNNDFACASSILALNGAALTGAVPVYAEDPSHVGESQTRMLVSWGAAPADGSIILRVATRGTGTRWDVTYGTGGTLALSWWDSDGNLLGTTGPVAFAVDGLDGRLSLELNGGTTNTSYSLAWLQVGRTFGGVVSGTTGAGVVAGTVSRVQVNPKGLLTDTAVGHVSVERQVTTLFDLWEQLNAYQGEPAGARIARLCAEESVPFFGFGDMTRTVSMGAQRPGTLTGLLTEAADADLGILGEYRDQLGLSYRTSASMAAPVPAAAIPYASVTTLEPTEDDALLRNDITVTRPSGGLARATLSDDTALSIAVAGRYAEAVEVNVAGDDQLADAASMRLALGVADESRFPAIGMDLFNPRNTGAAGLGVRRVDVGDRVTITDPVSYASADDLEQVICGVSEQIGGGRVHRITLRGAPFAPRRAGIYGPVALASSRYSSDGSVLSVGDYSSTAAGFFVTTETGPLWTTDPAAYPLDFMVAGERVTVTAVAAFAGTTQTFTVIRSVNGVVKAQLVNTPITLAEPARYGL
jgi:hypothetical protein